MLKRLIILMLLLLTAILAVAQEADLDRKFYFTKDHPYATLRVVSPSPGLQLIVILYDKDKNVEQELINKPLVTSKEKFLAINLLKLHTGNYAVEVYIGREWKKVIDMVVLQGMSER